MAHDTIPEHESEHTRRFRIEREHVDATAAKSKTLAMVLAGIISILVGGTGAGGTYIALQREAAETQEQVRALEREMQETRRQLGDVAELQRDVAALSARVSEWRTADLAARASEREELQRRLTRIEELLDRRRR